MTISQSLPHDSGHLHVTGRAHYVDDIPVPRDCLHLAFGLSELAAGQIKDIDLAPVQNAEGVVAVITATDLPFANDVSPSAHDEPLLSDGRVHYIGQRGQLRLRKIASHSSACNVAYIRFAANDANV